MQTSGPDLPTSQKLAEEQKRQKELEERKRIVLRTILEPLAYERLQRVAMVKPDRASQVEAYVIENESRLSAGGKISEQQIVAILEQLTAGARQGPKVTIARRPGCDSSDDEDW